ncbi:alpha/beta hydrolase [soil metagenome]
MTPVPSRRRRAFLAIAVIAVVLVVVGAAGFLWYAQPRPLLPEATAALASTPDATYTAGPGERITFVRAGDAPRTGLVLYAGGTVPPAAYAPVGRAIAEAGYLVALVPAPFGLAILDVSAAEAVIDDHPEITSWSVGGHSLGGAAAALFIDGHPGLVDGLVLWASYSSADLSGDGVLVSSSYGSLDRGRAVFTSEENVAKLGPAVVVTTIDGGNHEQMGWYTGQPDDPPATISRQEQQDRIVAATLELLEALDQPPLE